MSYMAYETKSGTFLGKLFLPTLSTRKWGACIGNFVEGIPLHDGQGVTTMGVVYLSMRWLKLVVVGPLYKMNPIELWFEMNLNIMLASELYTIAYKDMHTMVLVYYNLV